MNIHDLPVGSYQVTTPGTGAPLNVKNLAPGSYTVNPPPPKAEEAKPSLLGKVGNALISSEKGLGGSLGDAMAVNTKDFKDAQTSQSNLDSMNVMLGHAIAAGKSQGKDTTRLEKLYQENTKQVFDPSHIAPSLNKTPEQIYGEGAGVALDIAAAGTYGKAVKGAESFKLLPKVTNVVGQEAAAKTAEELAKKTAPTITDKLATFGKGFLKGAVKNAPIGAGYGASQAMQDNKSFGGTVKSAAGGAVFNALVGGLFEGKADVSKTTAPFKAQELKNQAMQQYKIALGATKEKYKEMSEQVIPKLLEEGKWGTRGKLLGDALNNIKLSQDKYKALGELQGVAEIDGIQQKIEAEMAKLKTPAGNVISTNQTKFNALEGLKKDIQDYVVANQVSEAGGPIAVQQQLRELAQSYGETLYETRKSLKTIGDSATLSEVQKVDGAIRDLLGKKNPTYATINEIFTHNSRLVDILNETKNRESTGVGVKKMIEIASTLTGLATGGAVGSHYGTVGGVAGSLAGTATVAGLATMLESTWWNSLRAVQKNNAAEKLLKMPEKERNQAWLMLGRQGAKYAKQIGIVD